MNDRLEKLNKARDIVLYLHDLEKIMQSDYLNEEAHQSCTVVIDNLTRELSHLTKINE